MFSWLLFAWAATAEPIEDLCAKPEACRQVDTVRIQNADGKESSININQQLPWVVQGNLLLVPGDWIVFRLVDRDGALSPDLVKAGNTGEPPAPGIGEIRVRLQWIGNGNLSMVVLSRRPETLDYAALAVVGMDNPQRTSVCSLRPGITAYESWQWPIRQIAVWGFRPTDDPGCRTIDLNAGANKK